MATTPAKRRQYARPTLTRLGAMRDVTRKSFEKGGIKTDPDDFHMPNRV